jgi:hypothetical protein
MAAEGWEWLKDQPPTWEEPVSLQSPTASAALNLGLQIIGSNIVGNDLVEVVAEFIGEKARLELWMGHLDPPLTLRKQFAIGRAVSEAVRIAYEAWVGYETAHRAAGGKVAKVGQQRSALLVAVRESTDILLRARSHETE